jgi:hypothetical protein
MMRQLAANQEFPDQEDVIEDATSQDVVDALRFLLMAQKNPTEVAKLVEAMLEFAPETENDRGIALIVRLIAEGSLKAALVDV